MAAPVAVLAFTGAVLTARKPPSWLGWYPPWVLAAAGAGLAVLGTWLVAPWATRRRRRADEDRAALDELGRYLGWSTRPPLLSEMDPAELGVHQAIRPSPFPQTKRWGGRGPVLTRGCRPGWTGTSPSRCGRGWVGPRPRVASWLWSGTPPPARPNSFCRSPPKISVATTADLRCEILGAGVVRPKPGADHFSTHAVCCATAPSPRGVGLVDDA
jgi:hypothetical protein